MRPPDDFLVLGQLHRYVDQSRRESRSAPMYGAAPFSPLYSLLPSGSRRKAEGRKYD